MSLAPEPAAPEPDSRASCSQRDAGRGNGGIRHAPALAEQVAGALRRVRGHGFAQGGQTAAQRRQEEQVQRGPAAPGDSRGRLRFHSYLRINYALCSRRESSPQIDSVGKYEDQLGPKQARGHPPPAQNHWAPEQWPDPEPEPWEPVESLAPEPAAPEPPVVRSRDTLPGDECSETWRFILLVTMLDSFPDCIVQQATTFLTTRPNNSEELQRAQRIVEAIHRARSVPRPSTSRA